MKIFEKNFFTFYLIIFTFIIFLMPVSEVKAIRYGCTIDGVCQNIIDNNIFQPQCEGGKVTQDRCPDINYMYFTKVGVNSDCSCNNIPISTINPVEAEIYLGQLTPQPEPCGPPVEGVSEPVAIKFRLTEGVCPKVNSTVLYFYHCIVIHDSEDKFKPGDCRELKSTNEEDARLQANNLCARDSAEAENVQAIPGECPAAKGKIDSLPGTSLVDLQKMASANLNPGNFSDPKMLISRAINLLTAFIGSVALFLYVVAGFLWMTARGASEQVDRAKKILVWTTLGVAIMLASYMLTTTLFSFIPR